MRFVYLDLQNPESFEGLRSLESSLAQSSFFLTYNFFVLRCEGPVCEDPGRPADGEQISESYEQGSKVMSMQSSLAHAV